MIDCSMLFVDCEASSLNDDSFPIEIAWVDQTGRGESHLICPPAYWRDWSAQAEQLHCISYAMLQARGEPVTMVADRVIEVCKGQTLVSDNPTWDEQWIGRLLATVAHDPLPFVSLDSIMMKEIQRLQQSNTALFDTPEYHRQARQLLDDGQTIVGAAVYNAVSQAGRRHRALPDAETLYRSWRLTKDQIDHLID